MRRIAIIMAGAALALALVGPAVAGATDKSTHAAKITAQSIAVDAPITAQHDRGHRDGRHDRHDRGHYRRGGRCYGCDGPGSRCGRYGCDYRYGGYYGGGYGCNYDYPCGEPRQYDCTKYRGPDGQSAQDPQCKYDPKCDCYYHSSQPPSGSESQPAPDQNAQPAPDQGQQPPADQGTAPGPAPDDGGDQPY
jgi:hypothetical protein